MEPPLAFYFCLPFEAEPEPVPFLLRSPAALPELPSPFFRGPSCFEAEPVALFCCIEEPEFLVPGLFWPVLEELLCANAAPVTAIVAMMASVRFFIIVSLWWYIANQRNVALVLNGSARTRFSKLPAGTL